MITYNKQWRPASSAAPQWDSDMPEDCVSDRPSDCGPVVVLRHADRELVLMPGKYLIGRSRSCQLVINDELVSRRHAELEVCANNKVVIRDLSSHNGVTVNEQCFQGDSATLKNGDRFVIGADTFQIFLSNNALESATMKVVEMVTETASTVVKRASKVLLDETRATHELDLVASVAECAIRAGQVGEAEKILAKHLRAVLADIRGYRQTTSAVRDKAFQYSLRIAEVTHKFEWFDFAVNMLFVQGIVCTEEQVEELLRVQKQLGKLETHRLEQYAQLVREKGSAIENRRIASLLDAIVSSATGARR
jgi:pSer/pThr/pTyr-binding forkhead associated (FHA) protein